MLSTCDRRTLMDWRCIAATAILMMLAPLTSAFGQATQPRGDGPLGQFDTRDLKIPRSQIRSGGPPKDGIPALTDPDTAPLDQVRFADQDRMVVVTMDDQTRAYPIKVLNWHEAVNDQLGDVPIAVIYCPLCDSVSVVDRRLGGHVHEFGISGLLYNSNVLLYDRTHHALWSQVALESVSGPHAGKALKHLPWEITTFADLEKRYPKAEVVTTETGHRRDYTRNPYARYFANDRLMFPVAHRDRRLGNKEPVVGVRVGDLTRAYPVEQIVEADGEIVSRIGDHTIKLQANRSGRVRVVDAPDEAQVVHTFWFAWAAFHPKTEVYAGPRHSATQPRR